MHPGGIVPSQSFLPQTCPYSAVSVVGFSPSQSLLRPLAKPHKIKFKSLHRSSQDSSSHLGSGQAKSGQAQRGQAKVVKAQRNQTQSGQTKTEEPHSHLKHRIFVKGFNKVLWTSSIHKGGLGLGCFTSSSVVYKIYYWPSCIILSFLSFTMSRKSVFACSSCKSTFDNQNFLTAHLASHNNFQIFPTALASTSWLPNSHAPSISSPLRVTNCAQVPMQSVPPLANLSGPFHQSPISHRSWPRVFLHLPNLSGPFC